MLRRIRFLSAAASALALVTPTFALEPSAVAARAGASDAMLARNALAALDSDPTLRPYVIVVSVVDGQAVIGGALPTPELASRAEMIVRRVTGIEVKNRCFVQSRPDPLIRAVADRLSPTARVPRGHDLPGMVSPPRSRTVEDAGYNPRTAVASASVLPPAPTTPTPTPTPTPVVTMKIPSNTGLKPSLLLDPTASPEGPRYASVPSVPTVSPVPTRLTNAPVGISIPSVQPQQAPSTMTTLLELRRNEARFAGITIELRDGTVYLAGKTPRDSDAWDFAERARRIPGVRQVVMGNMNRR